jgi:hypothetical protein
MPTPINVNDTQYYISAELELSNPDLYVNARKTKNRNVIITLQIPDTEYIFANKTKTNDLWKVLTEKSKVAKLLISKDWLDTFLKNKQCKPIVIRRKKTENTTSIVDSKVDIDIVDTKVDIVDTKVDIDIVDTKVDIDIVDTKVDNGIVDTKVDNGIDDTNDEAVIIEPVPPVLHLNDNEKFHDTDGNVLEIMTCGERHEDRIYFDMTDVSKAFEMPNLRIVLVNKNGAYTRGQDYKVFSVVKQGVTICYTPNAASNETSNENTVEKVNKRTFLTLSGLIRVLHVSRNKNAVHYCKWVNHIVYTHQFGTQDQKEELAANVLGVSAKIIKTVYNTISDQIPCVYLFTLGYVKDLRSSMQLSDIYDDDDVVAKYGFTKDLTRRTGEHIKKYGKIANSILRLKHNTFIDPLYLSNAETDIKSYVDSLRIKLDHEKEDELIVIPQRLEKNVKEQYNLIGAKYVGHNSVMITRIKFLESELEKETSSFENKMMLKNAEIDIIKRDTTIELLKRDSMIEKRDSTILLLKYENKELKYEMNMMVKDQQILEQKKFIENMNRTN